MYILLTAATHNELSATIQWLRENNGDAGNNEVEVLISGIGAAATTHALMRQFSTRTPELVLQAGIAGSFRTEYQLCSVVVVNEEVFADLGAFSSDGFDDIFDLGLVSANEAPFQKRMLLNRHASKWENLKKYPLVRGATINAISSTPRQINGIMDKYNPDIESMEGAALHYTCIMEDIPFLQLRGISNFVGERDKNKWMMKEAIAELNKVVRELLPQF